MKITTTKIILSVSSLLFVLVVGLVSLSSNQSKSIQKLLDQHKRELEQQNKTYLEQIDSLHTVIHNKELVLDSLNTRSKVLEEKIKANDIATKKKIEEVKQMTNEELLTFIINRYNPKP